MIFQDVKQERRSPQAGSSNPFAEELRQTNDWGKAGDGKKEVKEKEKVNLGLSGALTADQNTYKVSKMILMWHKFIFIAWLS